jgi:hypothetical protein
MAIHTPQKIVSVQNPKSLIGNWIFTLLWCALSFTLFGVFAIAARDVMGGIISGIFALFGVAMLYASITATLEYWRYGQVNLTLARPLQTGGKVEGRLELPANLQAGQVSAELACVQVVWSRNSKGHPSKSEHDQWTGKQISAIRRGAVASEALLAMGIPADQPGSSLPNEGPGTSMFEGHPGAGVEMDQSYTRWELRIKADVSGVDLARTFKLKVGGGGAAAPAPVLRPERPPLDTALEQRLDARKAAERKLGAACAIIGFVPFVVPFAIVGIGVGLAGCPMGWSDSNPPNCMLAGINWGRLMAGTVKVMFIAVPVGIASSAVLFFAGQAWLDRHHLKNKAAGPGRFARLAIGAVVVGFFVYQAWQFSRPFRAAEPAPPQVSKPIQGQAW